MDSLRTCLDKTHYKPFIMTLAITTDFLKDSTLEIATLLREVVNSMRDQKTGRLTTWVLRRPEKRGLDLTTIVNELLST